MNPQTKPDVGYLTPEHMKELPFSIAVRIDAMLYLSGMMGLEDSMKFTRSCRQSHSNAG